MTYRPKTSRDERQRIIDAHKFNEAMYGSQREAKGIPAPVIEELKPKRVRGKRVVTEASEATILKAIMQLLRAHPKVAKVWRQNSGTFEMQGRFVRANTARGMSDIMGILKNGRTLAIEVKAARGIVQPHQQAFLDSISSAGGLAFVARCVDDVIDRLK